MKDDWWSRVEIREGDLTESSSEAIVNAANTELILGSGVAGAIRAKGGPAIQAECDRHGPIPLGEAAVTTGGRLAARWVIHAAAMRPGTRVNESSLRAATHNALLRAHELRLGSIALPAIGTGVGGLGLEASARVMMEEVREALKTGSSLERVEFVLFGRAAFEAFQKEWQALQEA